ncbi:MAG: hypothetical protein CM15mP49_13790 [Actinomycetota bacterium]|nr:MAG: hypothetical protein CM15mP49_13790 [Actinomycetota bacterium]
MGETKSRNRPLQRMGAGLLYRVIIDEVLMISEQNASNASVVGGLYGRPERGKSSRFTKSSKANESGRGGVQSGTVK